MRALVGRTRLASASAEGVTVAALDADVVGEAFGLVGDFIQAGFVAADGLTLFGEAGGGVLELFGALNLNYLSRPFVSAD